MKQSTCRILLCLILSFLTTVCVAWGFAIWMPLEIVRFPDNKSFTENRTLGYSEVGETEENFVFWERIVDEAESPIPNQIELPPTINKDRPFRFLPEEARAGWPLRCLKNRIQFQFIETWMDMDGNSTTTYDPYIPMFSLKHGIDVTSLFEWLNNRHRLPVRPIWHGFIINLFFYSLIWFTLFKGLGFTRQSIRKHRGRCPKCVYNLLHGFENGCPDCGWNRIELTEPRP